MGKGEIAHYFSHSVFKRLVLQGGGGGGQKVSLCGNGLNPFCETTTTCRDCSKLKVFADNKMTVTEIFFFGGGIVKNIVTKGENAGYQHIPTMFSKIFFLRVIKSLDCVVKAKRRLYRYGITCILRPLKASNESGLLQQVVFKCRFC